MSKKTRIELIGDSRGAKHGDVVEADARTAENLIAAGKAKSVKADSKS